MKTVTFDQNVCVITTTINGAEKGTSSFYFTKDLSVSMSNNETLQIIYQGKPIFIMSSDVNSPNYGNAVGAVGDVDLAFAELQSQMRKK